MIYEKLIRPVLFKTDPEKIHNFTISALDVISKIKIIKASIQKSLFIQDKSLAVKIGDINLANPVGLSAGFDKCVSAPDAYPMLGFGFVELGSVTFNEQSGNPKPRLWRLPADKGLIVYYGLSNGGVEKTTRKMEKLLKRDIPYGVSIAPSTGLALEKMADDYAASFLRIQALADYITLNVSCPNVASCDVFAQVDFIVSLIQKINQIKNDRQIKKDIFMKIGPHFKNEELDQIINACLENNITGIVATNLIKNTAGVVFQSPPEKLNHPGGISGKLLQDMSNRTISYIYRQSKGKLKIIGVGGIFTADDAYEKIKCGASAVQMITGFIYGGPFSVRRINKGLIELLKKDGFKNIGEAVGISIDSDRLKQIKTE